MHRSERVELRPGKNTLRLAGKWHGFEIARLFLTQDENFVPSGPLPAGKGVLVDAGHLTAKENVLVREVSEDANAACLVEALFPDNCELRSDFYQPTIDPVRPCLKFEATAVTPDFTSLLFPHTNAREAPRITR